MKRYILHRVYLLLPTLLGALTLVFFLIHLIPGDPIEVMLGETASAADKEDLRRTLGLNQPVASQYKSFLNALAHGNLGQSLYEQASVADLIRARLPATIELTLCAMAVALLISFPLATLASVNKDTWIDRFALLFSLLGLSMPNFWLGPLLMIVFSIQLGWAPVSGRGGLSHLFLPSFTLGMGMAAIITETIFSWPGIGRLTVQAIQTRDYPLVQGCVLIIAISYLLVNFFTDIFYHLVDPRITYGR